MKQFPRLQSFRMEIDETSAYLAQFRPDITFFTDWPSQDNKTLNNIVSTHIKLILVERGECELTGQQTQLITSPGSIVFIPPYTVYSAKTGKDVHSYELFFNMHPVTREQEFLQHLNLSSIQLFPDLLTSADFNMLAACYADQQEKRPGAYAALSAMLLTLLLRVVRAQGVSTSPSAAGPTEQRLVERMLVYLSEHIGEPVRVEHLCDALRVSQSYLYRCSRSVMNCSPSQLITRHKLRHAQVLLRDPDLTVSEVAAAIGYDPYYFSAQFKKNFLMSPSDYRKKLGV